MIALQVEQDTFDREKARLIADHEGKWALIRGLQVIGIWDTYEDALKAGYERFGLESFMVKQILGIERVQHITRDIPLCPS